MSWNGIKFDWNHARAFLVTAKEGSLSRAARALNTTQPTLSRQVAALEAELSIDLFERVGKGMLLTAAGEQLLQSMERMADAANEFSLAASGQSQNLVGTVSISASEIDAIFRLPEIIAYLHQHEPGITLDIIATNEVSDLMQREADIAIRSFRPTEGNLIAKKLCDEKIWFYGTNEYVNTLQAHPESERVAKCKIIGFHDTDNMLKLLRNQGWDLDSRNVVTVSHSQMLHWQLVKSGLALGLFPEAIGQSDNSLQIAFAELEPVFTLPLWLVSHRELRTNARVRRVFDVLVDFLGSKQKPV